MILSCSDKGASYRGSEYKSVLKRSMSTDQNDYERVVKKLNKLQSNASTIQKSENQGPMSHVLQTWKVESTVKYLSRIGVSREKLDTLSVIHIAGTKGKGTTAALCESILRNHGYKTGFFSSPHLVAARERIRIDGVPISERKFADYFERIHNQLEQQKDDEEDMPAYFKFLTVMAFQIFLKEQVRVAIIEVGIGGEYDCTNCIRKPAVVGITSLGLDHTRILGSTLPDIAWQKAGIMKPGALAFTVPQASPAAMEVLEERAKNRRCSLRIVPSLDSYVWDTPSIAFTHMVEDVYATNASLALQLANAWMTHESPYYDTEEVRDNDMLLATPFVVTREMNEGLVSCSWPGRTQVLRRGQITYFLDGAHTDESIAYCMRWFKAASLALQTDMSGPKRVLIFNVTGERDSERFLRVLSLCNFHGAIFPRIAAFPKETNSSDQFSMLSTADSTSHLAVIWDGIQNNTAQTFGTVSEALNSLLEDDEAYHVLITGSVHLIGCALRVLDPNLSNPVRRVPVSLRPLQSVYSAIQTIL